MALWSDSKSLLIAWKCHLWRLRMRLGEWSWTKAAPFLKLSLVISCQWKQSKNRGSEYGWEKAMKKWTKWFLRLISDRNPPFLNRRRIFPFFCVNFLIRKTMKAEVEMLSEWLKTSTTFQRKQKPMSDLKVPSTENHRTNLKNIVQKKGFTRRSVFSLLFSLKMQIICFWNQRTTEAEERVYVQRWKTEK